MNDYSLAVEEFQKRLTQFLLFWATWEKYRDENINYPEPNDIDVRETYDRKLSDYEKEKNVNLTFFFSEALPKMTCMGPGEFVMGLFLEKLGMKFRTEVKNDDLNDRDDSKDIDGYMDSPFDFYVPSLKLLIEVDGIGYHVFSLCRDPETCKCKSEVKNERVPPTNNVNKHIDKYYGKDNVAKIFKIPLLRVIGRDLLGKDYKIQFYAFSNFMTTILKPFIKNEDFGEDNSVKKKLITKIDNFIKACTETDENCVHGIISYLEPHKKYGWIQDKPGKKKFFFHITNFIDYIRPEELVVGRLVLFEPRVTQNGEHKGEPYAFNIHLK